MDDATLTRAIKDYLPQVIHLSLGTCIDNKPWVCEVHFAYDDELTLYWRSTTDRRHSQEIAINPQVAGNIVMQHGQGEKPRGIYFEGRAELLTGVDAAHPAYTTYAARFGRGQEILEEATRPDGAQFYKLSVSDWYMFDVRSDGPKGKFHVQWS